MALTAQEQQQIRERLDNLEQLPKLLDRIAPRDGITPTERSRLQDASRVVEQAIPWVKKVVQDDPFATAMPEDD